jgi:hypothetical protein
MKSLATLAALFALIATAFGTDPKETMCVKQKDGTYRCKASGKIEKVPCCDTPANPEPKRTPRPKK